ncbi:MAG TPA: DNA-primase RepB domain-containing protein, partial [Rhizomicrobium sp.]|nr:DNA-primase RepB domain-containing protein [Rhizomicrobium sp.]
MQFLKTLFAHTTNPIYVCSFPNERNDESQVGERHVITRTPAHITKFVAKWDRKKRGLFFGVGTVQASASTRKKETIAETIGLHVDIDFKHVDLNYTRDQIVRKLTELKYPPSAIVFSGGGLHCYWLFKEPLETQGNIERIELALHQLADLVAGDPQCCEVSRVLRVPGSHNTKDGAWTEVEVLALNDLRYELDDLEEWLSEQSPILLRKSRERGRTVGEIEEDFFARFAKEHGIKPPIDVDRRLKDMIYMGAGDSSIHQTQIQCAASMLSRGMAVDDVVAILLAATKVAAGDYGTRWNWRIEERNIRRDCVGWIKKHPPEKKPKAEAKAKPKAESSDGGAAGAQEQEQEETAQAASGGAGSGNAGAGAKTDDDNVVEFPQPGVSKGELHIALGRAVLAHMRAQGEALVNGRDGSWLYAAGIWELRVDIKAWLDARIEEVCRGLGFKSNNKLVNETRCWIIRNPELRRDEIPWDQHGKIPTRSGL